ncbi:MAG: hypothetical protein M0Q13_07540 [Methanothrix sp.]|jgi:hypothetical protein|nr:hypothetical protein [Methanothrix sp.]
MFAYPLLKHYDAHHRLPKAVQQMPLQVLSSFQSPRVLTIKTLRFMNTDSLIAFRAAPPFFFGYDEMPYAEFSNVLEIADLAHAILSSIPLIQMVQPDAGEAVTAKAVLDISVHYLLAVFDSTYNAGF